MGFDWAKPAAGDARQKEQFHTVGRTRLRQLAKALGLEKGAYDLRSNKGGNAVSGEVTLHSDELYVQISQPFASPHGILIRTCEGRNDYTGGHNHFAPLAMLDDTAALARRVSFLIPSMRSDELLDSMTDEERTTFDSFGRR